MSNFVLRKTHRLQAVAGLTKPQGAGHTRPARLCTTIQEEDLMFELYVFSVLVTLAIAACLGAK